ncbi:MAG: phosphotransferase family protein [Gammaproteobacteria bacterium]|nr:phosphotransferase family protein [Gammaproteobacteria bacterium]
MHRQPFRETPQAQHWDALAAHLAAAGLPLATSRAPRQFATGYANLNYLLELDCGRYVLRRPPAGPLPPGAHDMQREYRVLSRLWRAYPLAPRAVHLCADEAVLGAPFFLMEYRPGIVITADLPQRINRPAQTAYIAEQLLDALVALHRVDPRQVDLHDLGKPEGFLRRQVRGWTQRAALAYRQAPSENLQRITTWLAANTPSEQGVSLVHNDFKLDNVILHAQALTPVGVIDWDMCTRGDPLFDLAVLLSYWTQADDPPAMHALHQMPTAASGFPRRAEILSRYCEAMQVEARGFLFYRVLATFRLAIVFRQLYNLWQRGAATRPESATFDAVARGQLHIASSLLAGEFE